MRDRLRVKEMEYMSQLKQLLAICETFKGNGSSRLDPMMNVSCQTDIIANSLRLILVKYSSLPFYSDASLDFTALLSDLLEDRSLLDQYRLVLFTAIDLILNENISLFRIESHPQFVTCIINIYSRIIEYSSLALNSSDEFISLQKEFQYLFSTKYENLDSNLLKFNNVHDLHSFSNGLVSSFPVRLNEIVNRGYFILSIEKLNYKKIPVEIFQLSNGHLAIFKVDSEYIPSDKNDILSNLLNSKFQILNVGRSLLFPFLRKNDLVITNLLTGGCILKTKVGNNIELHIQSISELEWNKYWNLYFHKLFDEDNILQIDDTIITTSTLNKSTHHLQSFKIKYDEITKLRPENTTGLAIQAPAARSLKVKGLDNNVSNLQKSMLHRSKPLTGSLSSLIVDEMKFQKSYTTEDLSKTNNNISGVDAGISIENEIKNFRLSDNNTTDAINNKQTSLLSASNKNSPEKVNEVSDVDSIISELLDENEAGLISEQNIEASITSSPEYIPSFYKKKSSSLLSVFAKNKSKNKTRKLQSSDNILDNNSPIFGSSTSSSLFHTEEGTGTLNPDPELMTSSVSSKYNSELTDSNQDYFEVPDQFRKTSSNTVFEADGVKLSSWTGKGWSQLGNNSNSLSIIEIIKNNYALVLTCNEDTKYGNNGILICKISASWKCMRSTAQDIQFTILGGNIVSSIIPIQEKNLFSIRYTMAEGLINVLSHCMRGNLPISNTVSTLSSSTTAGTLSTANSSYFDSNSSTVSNSFSNLSELGAYDEGVKVSKNTKDYKTSLLLPSIRVKYHQQTSDNYWKAMGTGNVNIYSQEYQKVKIACKFEITYVDSNNRKEKKSSTFVSYLHKINKVGRTGISLTDFATNNCQLLEFQNQIVADQVFKLLFQ
ncbi:hypothetical protein Kpol_2001p42 [Vanderwaltozyma polyspora DSM 70294]|uniref:Uncharacterized protein n=1 Tax=Vanderwaltozyma polyspora (strain ATCC 22028 / DSM 70294 / BCRC 21397 / CBS 2163 / NBRC 10782 / NRRL Y-8283 / UCD 57-17) TaxID=436907 RepID=A7TGS4_VANPO|nr:uncharacterized protein Kpol_2001p42 [Vanderwaltozyma polyspora DSM 70294]EDO18537.1 hypothetical protein Kpol_2001p42 [Vanderwaltozyma polyspora DSM 70294]